MARFCNLMSALDGLTPVYTFEIEYPDGSTTDQSDFFGQRFKKWMPIQETETLDSSESQDHSVSSQLLDSDFE